MRMQSNLGVVLAILREEGDLSADDGPLVRGESTVPPERRRAVVDHVRTNERAQLTLFLLAVELKAGEAASDPQLVADLCAFAEAVYDRFDVNLLRTAASNRNRLPATVPDDLLDERNVAALDG